MNNSKNIIKNFSTKETLDFLMKNGIIDMDTVKEEMNKRKRKEILQNHPFSIWQAKDGRWKTKVHDTTRESGKRLIAKSTRAEVEDAIVAHYTAQEEQQQLGQITLRDLYSHWVGYKILNGCAESTIPRINSDWNLHYLHSKIIDIPIVELDELTLKTWILELISQKKLNKKQYFNVSLIIRQMLDYAVEKKVISFNPFRKIKINTKKLLEKEKKKCSETQIFYPDEIAQITKWAMDDFHTSRKVYQLSPLAVLFQFQTALRIGELCTIRYNDIVYKDNKPYLHVQRMIRRDAKKVVEHTKTDAGDRYIPLTNSALHIISLAQQRQIELDTDSTGFIFSHNGQPLTERSVSDLYRKYSRWLGGAMHSSHDARRTVISMLLDSGMSINAIREIAGHEEERTTLHYYGYTSLPAPEIAEKVSNTLDFTSCNPK